MVTLTRCYYNNTVRELFSAKQSVRQERCAHIQGETDVSLYQAPVNVATSWGQKHHELLATSLEFTARKRNSLENEESGTGPKELGSFLTLVSSVATGDSLNLVKS